MRQHPNPAYGVSDTLPPIPVEELKYNSLSEFACAKLLERHTLWRGVPGVTIQIPLGRTTFDFCIAGTLVEYHPISLRREFLSDGLREILSAIHKLPRPQKLRVLTGISEELEAQYGKRRRQVAAAHPHYRDSEVIIASSPESFIRDVIMRFSHNKNLKPNELLAQFRKFQREGRSFLS